MNYIKRLWWHYLVLLILIGALAFPIHRVYLFFQIEFGQEAALIALALTVMVVMILVVRGAVHTHRLIRDLKLDLANDDGIELPADRSIPLILKLFRITPSLRKKKNQKKGMQRGLSNFHRFSISPPIDIAENRHAFPGKKFARRYSNGKAATLPSLP